MNVVSLFSGIGGLDLGLRRAGFEHLLMCESEPYRRDVLRARFPGVPVYDDVRALGESAWRASPDGSGAPVDERRREAGTGLLCGGFPCQDLSVAGQRRGLAGERSGLFFEFARIANVVRPGWVLVENVPGLLSSNGGRDFGTVLGTLADIGYGVAWRILDSRFFGVPQRRRRVFVVGARADGDPRVAAERASQVLAVGSRCPRHPATRGEAREDAANTPGVGFALRRDPGGTGQGHNTNYVASLSGLGTGGPDDNDGQGGRLIAETVRSHPRPGSNSNGNLVASPPEVSDGHHGYSSPRGDGADNLVTSFHSTQDPIHHHHHHHALGQQGAGVAQGASVRRLTPVECERLQGFPDGWTDIGGTPDSKRYAALGDAVTVPVAEWIGRRLIAA